MNKQETPAREEKPCPKCGSPMRIRSGKFGQFYGCSQYPQCEQTEKIHPADSTESLESGAAS